ncbi:MAG: PepSY domain-containing protein [Vicinamibacteria bacterium]
MFLAAFFLAFGTGGLSAQTTTEEPDQSSIQGSLPVDATDLEPMAKIGPEEAQEKALTALRNATVEEVELQIQDGYLVYELEVHVGTEDLELELVIDAGDGRVLAAEVEDDDAEDEEEEDDER